MSIFSNRINATCPTCGALTHQLAINTVAYKLAGCPECLSTIDITDDAATKALPPKIQEMKKATKTCPNCNAAISDYNKDIVYGKDGVIGCSACIRVSWILLMGHTSLFFVSLLSHRAGSYSSTEQNRYSRLAATPAPLPPTVWQRMAWPVRERQFSASIIATWVLR